MLLEFGNVWKSITKPMTKEKLPIMVWIHGGGWIRKEYINVKIFAIYLFKQAWLSYAVLVRF